MKSEKIKGIIVTIFGAVCWGISGCFGQYLFTEKNMEATWLVTIRLIIAGFILVGIGTATKGKTMLDIFKDKKDIKSLVIFSIFGMLACQLPYFLAVQHSNAGTATVLQALNAVLILIYVCIKELRKPSKIESFALLLAFCGTFLLTTGGDIHTMNLSVLALVFGLMSAFGAMAYSVLSIRIMKKYGVYVTVGYGMLIAGFCLLPITQPWEYNIVFDTGTFLGIAGVVVIGTVVAFSFYLKGISMIGPFMGGVFGNVEPVTAILVSVLFLGSSFTIVELIGFVVILSTVLLLSIYYKPNK